MSSDQFFLAQSALDLSSSSASATSVSTAPEVPSVSFPGAPESPPRAAQSPPSPTSAVPTSPPPTSSPDDSECSSPKFPSRTASTSSSAAHAGPSLPNLNAAATSAFALLRKELGELFPIILEKNEISLRTVDDAIKKLALLKNLLMKNFIPGEAWLEKWEKVDGGVLVLDVLKVLKCPLSNKIFMDPVIIASGHTFEQKHMEERLRQGLRTCPVTGEVLYHTHIHPNHLVRELIDIWLRENGHLEPKHDDYDERVCSHADQMFMRMQLERISKSCSDESEAIKRMRIITSRNPEYRDYFGTYPVFLPHLFGLLKLERPDSSHHVQEDLLILLANIAEHPIVRTTIMGCDTATPLLMGSLRKGTVVARRNAALVLFKLAEEEVTKIVLGENGVLRPLIELLDDGHPGAIKEAAMTVARLCEAPENKDKAVKENVIAVTLKKIRARFVQEEMFSILAALLNYPRAVDEMLMKGGVDLLREVDTEITGGEGGSKCSGVLHSLATYDHQKGRKRRGKAPPTSTNSQVLSPLAAATPITPDAGTSGTPMSPASSPQQKDKGIIKTIKKAMSRKKE